MEIVPSSNVQPRAGQFLLSEPFLTDPWFGRKVVFLCDHDAEGSMGFVLDNGMGRNLTSLLPDAEDWHVDHEVHCGGPIHEDSLFYIHRLGDQIKESIPVLPGLWMGGDFDALKAVLDQGNVDTSQVRFFAGYSGWTTGQLEHEMSGNSWYVHDLPLEQKLGVVMNAEPQDLWAKLLASKGPEFEKVIGLPQDPSLN
jgi:putative transcriptional regulator